MSEQLSYAVVTPVRDEAANLERLAGSLVAQTIRPRLWVIVDTGSGDRTLALAAQLSAAHEWMHVLELPVGPEIMRGGPIVRAFHAGLRHVPDDCDVVVKQDADTSMEADYFERILAAFSGDERLGITGGMCYEKSRDGIWRQRHGTGHGVWGASRAYRRACLEQIMPLEERMGWDTLDAVAAAVRGWSARVVEELPFLHHRVEGARERTRLAFWTVQGEASYYMGYRPSYLVARMLYRMLAEPSAIGVGLGFLRSALRRDSRCADRNIRDHVRAEQSFARLPRRIREARRPRDTLKRLPEGS